jgi:hypothetical protein
MWDGATGGEGHVSITGITVGAAYRHRDDYALGRGHARHRSQRARHGRRRTWRWRQQRRELRPWRHGLQPRHRPICCGPFFQRAACRPRQHWIAIVQRKPHHRWIAVVWRQPFCRPHGHDGVVLGNRVITNAAFHSAHVPFRFQGRFFGSPWPWWWGGIVIGWVGPVFWPYVYYDFFDYVFWPYAYDDFWPYAYDDIYYGIYGPYAYSGPLAPVASVDPSVASSPHQLAQAKEGTARQRAQTQGAATRAAEVCSNKASELAQWPIERISQVVQPTDTQRPALDELKAESAKAIDLLKSGCPNDLPSIPTGRLAAMQTRLETMLAAVKTVHPALDHFYQSLNDEQKARFNAIAPGQDSASAKDQRDLVAFCNARAPGVTDLPIDRIAEAVQPSESQRAALDALREASTNAAASLKADCPTYQVLTPVGRTEAIEQRLAGTLTAMKTVEPALTKFYDLLSDEQKARFNALRSVD